METMFTYLKENARWWREIVQAVLVRESGVAVSRQRDERDAAAGHECSAPVVDAQRRGVACVPHRLGDSEVAAVLGQLERPREL